LLVTELAGDPLRTLKPVRVTESSDDALVRSR
jgi:hypothetical protein